MKRTQSQLKKKLWKLLAPEIKKRDKGICQACGRRAEGKNYHAGHLIPKSICGVVLAFHPLNLWGECGNCNIWAGGNGALLAANVSKKVGYDIVAKLQKIRKETKSQNWDSQILDDLITCLKIDGFNNYTMRYALAYKLYAIRHEA